MIAELISQTAAPPDVTNGWSVLISGTSGWIALTALVLGGVLTVPKHYKDLKEERDLLRQANAEQSKRNDVLAETVATLVEQNKTVIHLVESIKSGPQ